MRAISAVLIVLCLQTPAFASDCLYSSGINDASVSFRDLTLQSYDGDYHPATVTSPDGKVVRHCKYILQDEASSEIVCPGGAPSYFVIVGKTIDDDRGGEIMVYENTPFYRDPACKYD